jgi:DNA-binding transcriptional MerR regulator
VTTGSLTIGQVAAAAGVAIDTVRYYERRGVLPPIARRSSGYRAFPPETVERIAFVKELQSLGFNLDEVIGLLRAADANEGTCEPARGYATAILGRIDEKIRALVAIRGRLAGLVDACDAGGCGPLAEATPRIRLPRAKRR